MCTGAAIGCGKSQWSPDLAVMSLKAIMTERTLSVAWQARGGSAAARAHLFGLTQLRWGKSVSSQGMQAEIAL